MRSARAGDSEGTQSLPGISPRRNSQPRLPRNPSPARAGAVSPVSPRGRSSAVDSRGLAARHGTAESQGLRTVWCAPSATPARAGSPSAPPPLLGVEPLLVRLERMRPSEEVLHEVGRGLRAAGLEDRLAVAARGLGAHEAGLAERAEEVLRDDE